MKSVGFILWNVDGETACLVASSKWWGGSYRRRLCEWIRTVSCFLWANMLSQLGKQQSHGSAHTFSVHKASHNEKYTENYQYLLCKEESCLFSLFYLLLYCHTFSLCLSVSDICTLCVKLTHLNTCTSSDYGPAEKWTRDHLLSVAGIWMWDSCAHYPWLLHEARAVKNPPEHCQNVWVRCIMLMGCSVQAILFRLSVLLWP